jgi:hypothetical protein
MIEDRDGARQASKKARCGRLAASMRADEALAPAVVPAGEPPVEPAAPTHRRSPRLTTSERLRRLEEFSAA